MQHLEVWACIAEENWDFLMFSTNIYLSIYSLIFGCHIKVIMWVKARATTWDAKPILSATPRCKQSKNSLLSQASLQSRYIMVQARMNDITGSLAITNPMPFTTSWQCKTHWSKTYRAPRHIDYTRTYPVLAAFFTNSGQIQWKSVPYLLSISFAERKHFRDGET